MRLLPYVAMIPALCASAAAHAEAIALGNPFTEASFVGLFGLPLVGSAALLLAMALTKGLRKALLIALCLCGIFVTALALHREWNAPEMFWLVGLVFLPWVCFVIFAACFVVGRRAKKSETQSHERDANPSGRTSS